MCIRDRYSSNTQSIGVRYGDQNGLLLGTIEAKVTTFLTNGFSLSVTYSNGTVNSPNSNIALNVKPTDINNEGLLVFFTAYE